MWVVILVSIHHLHDSRCRCRDGGGGEDDEDAAAWRGSWVPAAMLMEACVGGDDDGGGGAMEVLLVDCVDRMQKLEAWGDRNDRMAEEEVVVGEAVEVRILHSLDMALGLGSRCTPRAVAVEGRVKDSSN